MISFMSSSGNEHILKARLARNFDLNNKESMRQQIDFLAVIDFEATCVTNPPRPPHPYIQEIIEFPIVLVDVAKQTIVQKHDLTDWFVYLVYSSRLKHIVRIADRLYSQFYQIIVNN
jgi:hypothetical protein